MSHADTLHDPEGRTVTMRVVVDRTLYYAVRRACKREGLQFQPYMRFLIDATLRQDMDLGEGSIYTGEKPRG